MAYYSSSNGQILVPSPQYLSQGAYHAPPINTYPQSCPASNEKLVPLPGRYSVTFSKTSAICLGAFLVCSGAVALVGSAFALRYYASLSEVGAGIWCGAMFVAAGSVAIAAGHHLTDCQISATTVTSAFAVAFSVALITISSIGLGQDVDHYSCYPMCHDNIYCPCYYDDWETLAIVGNSLMIGAGAFAFIFSFWLFVICCVALCRTPRSRVVPIYVQSAPQPMTNSVIPNQQVLSVPLQYVQMSAAPNQPLGHHQPERSENHRAGDHD